VQQKKRFGKRDDEGDNNAKPPAKSNPNKVTRRKKDARMNGQLKKLKSNKRHPKRPRRANQSVNQSVDQFLFLFLSPSLSFSSLLFSPFLIASLAASPPTNTPLSPKRAFGKGEGQTSPPIPLRRHHKSILCYALPPCPKPKTPLPPSLPPPRSPPPSTHPSLPPSSKLST